MAKEILAHADFAEPFKGSMFLILIDVHSKWIDVHWMASTTSYNSIEILRQSFSLHGKPEVLVLDNGTPFTSGEFKKS